MMWKMLVLKEWESSLVYQKMANTDAVEAKGSLKWLSSRAHLGWACWAVQQLPQGTEAFIPICNLSFHVYLSLLRAMALCVFVSPLAGRSSVCFWPVWLLWVPANVLCVVPFTVGSQTEGSSTTPLPAQLCLKCWQPVGGLYT